MLIDSRTDKPLDRESQTLIAEVCVGKAHRVLVAAIKDFGEEFDATNELYAHFMFALADTAASMHSSINELELDEEQTEEGQDQQRNIRNMIKADITDAERMAKLATKAMWKEMGATG